jgi:hypothetical protein
MKLIQKIISFIILFFLFINCEKKVFHPNAIVLLAVGDVKVGNKKLQVSDIIQENEIIVTGKSSFCDLQILGNESDTVIRIKELSKFSITSQIIKNLNITQPILDKGQVIINLRKLNKHEEFRTQTRTSIIGVRGTKFEVAIDTLGSTNVSVFDGFVSVKVRIPEIESLEPEAIETSSVLKTLDSKESIIKRGESFNVTNNTSQKILLETGIGSALNYIKSNPKVNLDSKIDLKTVSEKITLLDEKVLNPLYKPIEKNTFDEKLKEYDELISIEKGKLKNPSKAMDAIKERNKNQNQSLMKRIESIMGKASESIILKNGQKISGVVIEESNVFIVLTPEGKVEIPKSEVERFDL